MWVAGVLVVSAAGGYLIYKTFAGLRPSKEDINRTIGELTAWQECEDRDRETSLRKIAESLEKEERLKRKLRRLARKAGHRR